MMKIIKDLWFNRRDIISDGYDESLEYIARIIPLITHNIPSGTDCWTWIVPDKWTVKDAYIEDLDGKRVLDLKDHPLHVLSYSLPVDRVVTREELMQHLHTSSKRPYSIPFEFKYYEKDWGFCIQKHKLEQLTKDRYKVFIDSKFEKGNLKVGDLIVKGDTDDTIVIAAHLCHPAMVNDGLSGVAVLIEIAEEMLKRKKKWNYTYQFMILPETIGSISYLSQNEAIIPNLKYGLFLEMLGNDNIHALQLTRQGNTRLDRIARYVMKKKLVDFREGPFRTIVVNDEMVFNGPGVDIPMISISRFPYPEYHTSDDNPDIITENKLVESKRLILDILDILEKDYVPKRKFKGPVFLSRYGLWVDWRTNKKLNEAIDQMMLQLEGDKSVFDISEEVQIEFGEVFSFLNRFYDKGLIDKHAPHAI
jgi:aminopeptidase-like protein